MYNMTYKGVEKYVSASEKDLIQNCKKENFNAFEWENVPNKKQGYGLSTKIRMVKVQNNEIVPWTDWIIG